MPPAEESGGAVERLLAIKTLPLFADVHADDLAVIAEHARIREFREGDTVLDSGSGPVDSIHLVLDGRVTEHRNGRPFRVHQPLRVFGGVDALARSEAAVAATADVDTRTLSIERAALHEILEDNFTVLSVALQGVAAATLRLRTRMVPSAGFPEPAMPTGNPAPTLDELGARIAFLRGTVMRHARIRTLGQLARDAELLQVGDGERLWRREDAADHAIVVVHGTVACGTDDGRLRFRIGPPTLAGIEETLAAQARWYDAVAEGEVALLRMTRAALLDALEDDSDMALDALAALAAMASELRDRVAQESDAPA